MKGNEMADDKQVNVRMSEEIHRKLRLLAADLNIGFNELLVELIEKEYDNAEIVMPRKRTGSRIDESEDYSITSSMRLMRSSGRAQAEGE